MFSLLLIVSLGIAGDTSAARQDTSIAPSGPVRRATSAPSDTVRRRHSVELSDAYYTRLTVHRWGSYVELPLFATEYWLGDKLLARGRPVANWVRPAHAGVAAGLGGLFGLNTITGGWNLVEGWSQLGDNRRTVVAHTVLMLAADAGFAAAGALAGDEGEVDGQRLHRNVALASIGVATVGTAIMWITKNR